MKPLMYLLFSLSICNPCFAHLTEKSYDADLLSQEQHIRKYHPEVIWVNAQEYSNSLKTKNNQKKGAL